MSDGERYQTVYADRTKNRSVAAPTAGLHFTPELLARLEERGVEHEFVALDIGVGTFRPVKTEDVREHRMHTERCAIEPEQAARVTAARADGRRVVAVGTTAVRTLETFADESGAVAPGERDTDIFIRPGYRFKAVDALITNFHLPKSTLLMLVSAFAGHETTMAAYRAAVEERYRFFSFGDSMLVE
jgi:S-adenosylmethionine:tRNA ribosyltransferase-isomerase